MRIKKDDIVLIIRGKDKGKRGKVLKTLPKEERIIVEGINLKKKHIRPRRAGEKGEMVSVPGPMRISNVRLICPKCRKAARVGYRVMGDKKRRVCKKCGKEI